MIQRKILKIIVAFISFVGMARPFHGQAPPQAGQASQSVAAIAPANAYPPRPAADAAIVERGKELYGLHCAFCHGPDARGGSEGGPNLLRAQVTLNDQNGELIGPIVQNGRGLMPKFDLSASQISDIATFIHSFRVAGYDPSRERPPTIVVGNPTAGEKVFVTKCGACHSTSGDLNGFGKRSSDPVALQQAWLMPAGARGSIPGITNVRPTTATVTLQSGEKVEGRVLAIDDFVVSLQLTDESRRSFKRRGAVPKVELHDPLAPHKALLRTYTDKEIHDLTAYLVTLQ